MHEDATKINIFCSLMMIQVLSLHETISSYASVYYIGTVLPIAMILLSYVIKPARSSKSNPRKLEWVRNLFFYMILWICWCSSVENNTKSSFLSVKIVTFLMNGICITFPSWKAYSEFWIWSSTYSNSKLTVFKCKK